MPGYNGGAGGRPRTVSLSPEEMIKLGQEMVDWVKENKPVHLNLWWSVYKEIEDDDWKCYIQHKEFLPFYRRSLNLIGAEYLKKESAVDPQAKNKCMRLYYKDLRDDEYEKAKQEAELKKSSDETNNKFYFYYDNPTKRETNTDTTPLPMPPVSG